MKKTIENLKLNVEEAMRGRTWLLLPQEYRELKLAQKYPLPVTLAALRKISLIPVTNRKLDPGAIYIRRAQKEITARFSKKAGAYIGIERTEENVKRLEKDFQRRLKALEEKVNCAADEFRDVAAKAGASLEDILALGREGLEGQMKAHLAGKEWKDEAISASAFRQCYALGVKAVKNLGLPSDDRGKAKDAVIAEAAASLRATQAAVAMRPSPKDDEGKPN